MHLAERLFWPEAFSLPHSARQHCRLMKLLISSVDQCQHGTVAECRIIEALAPVA
jgi:hypothetical protein